MAVERSGGVRVPKLLLVEDNGICAQLFFAMVVSGEVEIVWADDLLRAFNAYELHAWDFDAIVLDGDLGKGETSIPLAEYINETGFPGRRIRITNHRQLAIKLGELGFCLECSKVFPEELLSLVC